MKEAIFKMAFVGSGVSCAYTLIHYLDLKKTLSNKERVEIIVIDKSGEFWTGIPYGLRSGYNSLIISSLNEFLPEGELKLFINWLEKNLEWIFDDFKEKGGKLSQAWLENNKQAIKAGAWGNLFIPRYIFGVFLKKRVEFLIEELTKDQIISCTLVKGEVVNIEKKDGIYKLKLADHTEIVCSQLILSMGSPEKKGVIASNHKNEDSSILYINNMYQPNLNENAKAIYKHLKHNNNSKQSDIMIVGSNASALESLYTLMDTNDTDSLMNYIYILSSNGAFPHQISSRANSEFIPENLHALAASKSVTAKRMFEAVKNDVQLASERQVNIADTYAPINLALFSLLNRLNKYQQQRFVHKYGVEIGKFQRRVGEEYIDVVNQLKIHNRIKFIKGKFILNSNNKDFRYLHLPEKKIKTIPESIKVIINCSGFQELSSNTSSTLIKNLMKQSLCLINASKRGLEVNQDFEIDKNFFLIGPLLAGNVNSNFRIWHAESCARIFHLSQQLANLLIK